MATSYIPGKLPQVFYLGRLNESTSHVDLTPYLQHRDEGHPAADATNSCVLLVVTKAWATGGTYSSVYMVTTIQNTNYVEAVELGKNANGATITVSGTSINISWAIAGGGTVTILKFA